MQHVNAMLLMINVAYECHVANDLIAVEWGKRQLGSII